MKRLGLRLLAVVLLVLVSVIVYIAASDLPHYDKPVLVLTVESTPGRVQRGRQIALMLCSSCHKDPNTGALTGRRMMDAPAQFGTLYSRNITQNREVGIGTWTDGELAYLLRTGILRDGRYAPPYMVKLPHMSDEDLFSIIAFLRSDDPLVAPSDKEPPPPQPSFLTKLLSRVAFKPLPWPEHKVFAPDKDDAVAYGKYLVTGFDCFPCHSADFKTMNVAEPEKSEGYMGGGNPTLDVNGKVVPSPNLTFDSTGIGSYTEAQFARALRDGFRPTPEGDVPIAYPMMRYRGFSDQDVHALYAYLQTVPKIQKSRAPPPDYSKELAGADADKQLYFKYRCVSCHGVAGKEGLFDITLAGKKYAPEVLQDLIKNPTKFYPDTIMPTWGEVASDEEIQGLARYVTKLGQ